jgi:hypothetical protein
VEPGVAVVKRRVSPVRGVSIKQTNLHTENYEKFKNRPTPKLPPERTDLRGPKSLTVRWAFRVLPMYNGSLEASW